MGITAYNGPLLTFGTGPYDPELAPSAFHGGSPMLLDPRQGYQVGAAAGTPIFGWGGQTILTIKQTPFALSPTNILNAVTGGTTGVSLINPANTPAGAGITSIVISTATGAVGRVWAIDQGVANPATGTSTATINYGGTGTATLRCYDPRTLLSRALRVTFAAAGDVGGGKNLSIRGWDIYGFPMQETITPATAGTAINGAKAWKYLSSITPNFVATGAISVGTTDIIGFPLRCDSWALSEVWVGNPATPANNSVSGATGFVAPVTTTASATSGDVRGTYALQTASTSTDGVTGVEVTVIQNLSPLSLLPTSGQIANNAWQGLFGVPQF